MKWLKQGFKFSVQVGVLFAAALLSSIASAHVGTGETSGFAHGFMHSITGLDHVATMVAVGLWAAQQGGRAMWVVPATFVSVMSAGGVLDLAGVAVPFVESGITASVLVLGLIIAATVRLPLTISALLVGLFAIFHGYAHGVEMPKNASGLMYGAGLVMATALLHAAGILGGLSASKWLSPRAVQVVGGAITAVGVYLSFA